MLTLNALNPINDINNVVDMVNQAGANLINPEAFYSKQLLDTIRYDQNEFTYFRLADTAPIQEKADKLVLRRWAPLQAHTVPLLEGIPPKSDKGSVEKYEMTAFQYGRYMEFSDKVDFKVVDPVMAHYAKEYSIVAVETLDLLAKETLLSLANRYYANMAADFEALTVASKPTMADLRMITLAMKKGLVKPRNNGRYHVIASPDFFFDMISDPVVEKYMTLNQTTKTMYENTKLVPMFDMEFYENNLVPTSSEYVKSGKRYRRMYRLTGADTYAYSAIAEDDVDSSSVPYVTVGGAYMKDSRTGADASYNPELETWDFERWNTDNKAGGNDWYEFKAQHIFVLGKDALTRTGLQGEDSAKMYTKAKGTTGVLDPIDQRQSIGFKINSVGFGSTRLEAIVDYICVPTQVNPV
jgi:hypothetical protein